MSEKQKKAVVSLVLLAVLMLTVTSSESSLLPTVGHKTGAIWGVISLETGGGYWAMISGVAASTFVGLYYGACFGSMVGAIAGASVGL